MSSERFKGREEKEILGYIEAEVKALRDEALREIEEFGPKGNKNALERFIRYDLWLKFHDAAQKQAQDSNLLPQEKPVVTDRGFQWFKRPRK